MNKHDSDVFMFQRFVLPVIAKAVYESVRGERARESAVFTAVADSPYAHLVDALQPEEPKP